MRSPSEAAACAKLAWDRGGERGLVSPPVFKTGAGRREAFWVGSIPTRFRQFVFKHLQRFNETPLSRSVPPDRVQTVAVLWLFSAGRGHDSATSRRMGTTLRPCRFTRCSRVWRSAAALSSPLVMSYRRKTEAVT